MKKITTFLLIIISVLTLSSCKGSKEFDFNDMADCFLALDDTMTGNDCSDGNVEQLFLAYGELFAEELHVTEPLVEGEMSRAIGYDVPSDVSMTFIDLPIEFDNTEITISHQIYSDIFEDFQEVARRDFRLIVKFVTEDLSIVHEYQYTPTSTRVTLKNIYSEQSVESILQTKTADISEHLNSTPYTTAFYEIYGSDGTIVIQFFYTDFTYELDIDCPTNTCISTEEIFVIMDTYFPNFSILD